MEGLPSGFSTLRPMPSPRLCPNAERRIIEGQSHIADPSVFAAVLAEFFTR
ncbi:hypothetical protein ACFQ68_07570 [Amycolatopsis japonica]|uniref:hypothetical protein n=1 Tax=Amycolatopsis japonica TaxID=208439 RepID=UPI00366B261D